MSAGAAARRPPPGQQGTPGALTLTPALQLQPSTASVDALPRTSSATAGARIAATAEGLAGWLGRLSPVRPPCPAPSVRLYATTPVMGAEHGSWSDDASFTM